MADSSNAKTNEPNHSDFPMPDEDDVTVVTTTGATKTDFIAAEMTELHIRYEINDRKGKADVKALQHHIKLLIALTDAFDSSTLRVFDNKNNRIKTFHEPKWLDSEYHQDHFQAHHANTQRKTVIVHRILSSKPLALLKSDPSVLQHLKSTRTFLRAHYWKQDEVELKDIGYLMSYIPTKHSKSYVINDMIRRSAQVTDLEWARVPAFRLIHAQPKVSLPGKAKTLKTHAFSVQVQTPDALKMNQILRQLYAHDKCYLPYSMSKKYPTAVAKAILNQNRLLKDTWLVILIGVPRAMMPHIIDNIRTIKGILSISDTDRTDSTGRWNIVVKETDFKAVRKSLSSRLSQWVNLCPSNIRDTPSPNFPPPQVYQKYATTDDNDSSSGQVSYMSSCAQSYGSLDDNDAADNHYFQPAETNGISYAAAVRQRDSPMAPTVTEVNVPMNPGIAHQLMSMQTNLKILQDRVGPNTPSTVTEASTSEANATLFTNRLDKFENNLQNLQLEMEKWMLEMRHMMQSQKALPLQGQHPPPTRAEPTDPSAFLPSPAKQPVIRDTPPRRSPNTIIPVEHSLPPIEVLASNVDGSFYNLSYTHLGIPAS